VLYNFRGGGSPELLYNVTWGGDWGGCQKTDNFALYNMWTAPNGDISTKFGLLIDFDLLKAVTLTNTKPEVVFSGRGRHFEK